MDGGVISYEVQSVKPEPDIYLALLGRYQLKAGECVFLDDRAENIAAAEQLGFHGIIVESFEQAEEALKKELA